MSDAVPAVRIRGLVKTFEEGRIPALRGVDLDIEPGEFVAITGPSGCGKSTLLHLIAALDRPDAGSIQVLGEDLGTQRHLSRYRADQVGIIFQLHNLLPTLSAEENVQIPMFEQRWSRGTRAERSRDLLRRVGMEGKERQRPAQLSGGERQRVAIARALANDPPILLADEPTGSLDSVAGGMVLDLIARLQRERGLTILLVTHDPSVAARADRIVRMLDGKVVEPMPAAPALAA
jgi:putative ABC transport system ATP-binding protein